MSRQIILLSCAIIALLFAPAAQAFKITCEGLNSYVKKNDIEFNSVEDCRAKADAVILKHLGKDGTKYLVDVYNSKTEEVCAFSMTDFPGIDKGRCAKTKEELNGMIKNRIETFRSSGCDSFTKLQQACKTCEGNESQLACTKGNELAAAASGSYQKQIQEMNEQNLKISKKLEKVGLELAQDYGNNRAQVEADARNGVANSAASRQLGTSSPQEALSMFQGTDSKDIFQTINDIQQASTISESHFKKIHSLKNPAFEGLEIAASAKAARQHIESEMKKNTALAAKLGENKILEQRGGDYTSLTDPAASSNGLAAGQAANAGAGLNAAGGALGAASPEAGGTDKGTYYQSNSAYTPNAALGGGNNKQQTKIALDESGKTELTDLAKEALSSDGSDPTSASGSSRFSLRDSLRAKLAARASEAKASARGVAAGSGSVEAVSDEKARETKMILGQATATLSEGGSESSGVGESFALAGSETDAAVQNLISEFSGDLSAEQAVGGRDLASVDVNFAPDIGTKIALPSLPVPVASIIVA